MYYKQLVMHKYIFLSILVNQWEDNLQGFSQVLILRSPLVKFG